MSIRTHTITIIIVKKHHTLAVLMQLNVTLMFVGLMTCPLFAKQCLDVRCDLFRALIFQSNDTVLDSA